MKKKTILIVMLVVALATSITGSSYSSASSPIPIASSEIIHVVRAEIDVEFNAGEGGTTTVSKVLDLKLAPDEIAEIVAVQYKLSVRSNMTVTQTDGGGHLWLSLDPTVLSMFPAMEEEENTLLFDEVNCWYHNGHQQMDTRAIFYTFPEGIYTDRNMAVGNARVGGRSMATEVNLGVYYRVIKVIALN